MNYQSAINYGLFVQFVALNWNASGTTTSLNGRQVVDPAGAPVIAGSSYTVKETIYAYDLATDIALKRGIPPGWVTIGVIAINDADPNDIVFAIRGTANAWEWLQDLKFLLIPFKRVAGGGLSEDGFTGMYNSFSTVSGDCATAFVDRIKPSLPAAGQAKITICGHSLGAALATLLAFDLGANTNFNVTLYTLASPRVGDLTFSHVFNHIVPNAYRVFNRLDVVPKVPPPLMYFHVGDETELVPPPTLRFDLACEHHLTSYFDMLAIQCGTQAQFPIQADCLANAAAAMPTHDPSAH